MTPLFLIVFLVSGLVHQVASHASIFHPSMWGFNVTDKTFPYDNRPVAPLTNFTFDQWWFHGHLDHPPHPEDVFPLPAGQRATTEIACTKGATSFFAGTDGGDIRLPNDPNNVCPGSPIAEFHTTGPDDVKGCALAIAYKSDVNDVKPEDFTVFSVNQTCVWSRFTEFEVPERMPACPDGKCVCAWFWIHSPDSGGEQNYMNGFQCNITNPTSSVPLAAPKVPRRCGADPNASSGNGNKELASLANCTYGAKQPLYWFQAERNTLFEGAHAPPFYNDLYNFLDGAQNDIFEDSYLSIPDPSPVAEFPVLNTIPEVIKGIRVPFAPVVSGVPVAGGGVGVGVGVGAGDNETCTGTCINLNLRRASSKTSPNQNRKRSKDVSSENVSNPTPREGWKRSRISAHLHSRRRRN